MIKQEDDELAASASLQSDARFSEPLEEPPDSSMFANSGELR